MVTPQSLAASMVVYPLAVPLGIRMICSVYVPSPTINVSPPVRDEIPRAIVAHGLDALAQLFPLSEPLFATYNVAASAEGSPRVKRGNSSAARKNDSPRRMPVQARRPTRLGV